jgi:hypothetical protein
MVQQGSNAYDDPTATFRGAQCGMEPGRRCAKAVVKSPNAVFLRAVRRLLSHPLKAFVC